MDDLKAFLNYISKQTFLANRNPKYGDFALKTKGKEEIDTDILTKFGAELVYIKRHLNIDLNIALKMQLIQYLNSNQYTPREDKVLVEFSSPNANKPQHIGHLRNNLLGDCVANILKYCCSDVSKINLINDRGVHICKSLLIYMRESGKLPDGVKGDHLVGDYYVQFCKEANNALNAAAQELLVHWENDDEEVVSAWKEMTNMVCKGFTETYKTYGIHFDHWQYESNLYKLGKKIVTESDLFKTAEDGSKYVEYSDIGLATGGSSQNSTVLRKDGTSIYLTQDIGVATDRIEKFSPDKLIYVVADEQNHHFRVLFKILEKLLPDAKTQFHHLSYGMISLENGRLKSRTGNTVDADTLYTAIKELIIEQNKESWSELSDESIAHRSRIIALAAIKFQFLSVKPAKAIKFDPKESIKVQGKTGPYLLYTYARLNSMFGELEGLTPSDKVDLLKTTKENELVNELFYARFQLKQTLDSEIPCPASICTIAYNLCKSINKFYNDKDHKLKGAADLELAGQRMNLLLLCWELLRELFYLLGIEMLELM